MILSTYLFATSSLSTVRLRLIDVADSCARVIVRYQKRFFRDFFLLSLPSLHRPPNGRDRGTESIKCMMLPSPSLFLIKTSSFVIIKNGKMSVARVVAVAACRCINHCDHNKYDFLRGNRECAVHEHRTQKSHAIRLRRRSY